MQIQNLTTAQKKIIKAIQTTPMNFGKFEIEPHPFIPAYKRYLEVYKPIIDLELKIAYIYYRQVLEDGEGNLIENNLPNPVWEITNSLASTVINFSTGVPEKVALIDSETNEPILDENGQAITEYLTMPTIQYMKFIEGSGMSLSKIISNYLPSFYEANKEVLNKLS